MKTFKLTDIVLQVSLILFSLVATFAAPERFIFLYGYFIVGGWQVTSCAIHLLQPEGWVAYHSRTHYNVFLKWVLLTGLFVFLLALIQFPLFMLYLYAMLFIAPVMAVWYLVICVIEWNILKKRAFIHLK